MILRNIANNFYSGPQVQNSGNISFIVQTPMYCLSILFTLFSTFKMITDRGFLSSHSQEQHVCLRPLFQRGNLCGRRRHLHLHLQRGLGRPHLWPKLVPLWCSACNWQKSACSWLFCSYYPVSCPLWMYVILSCNQRNVLNISWSTIFCHWSPAPT